MKRPSINICVRMPNWLGDIVLSLPALAAIRNHYPSAKLCVAVLEKNRSIFDHLNYKIDGILTLNRNLLSNCRAYRKEKPDIIIYFTNSIGSAIEGLLAGIPERIGYNLDRRKLLLTKSITPLPKSRRPHQAVYYIELLSVLGIDDSLKDLGFSHLVSDNDKDILDTAKVTIGINAGAAFGSAKRWPPRYFRQVAKHFIQKGRQVVLFGAPGQEAETAAEIVDGIENVINLAGKTTLSELISLIGKCDLFITNDSGPMHIAAGLNRPVVAIFGPTNINQTSPLCAKNVVVHSSEPCAPCMKRECPLKHHNCMNNVTPEKVIEAAERLLG